MTLITFLASSNGRLVRFVLGALLLVGGLALTGAWLVLSAVGVVVIVATTFNVCVLAPIVGRPMIEHHTE